MDLLYLIALAKVLLCAIILSLTSFEDWKTREISDVFWFVMGGCGATLTVMEIMVDFSSSRLMILILSVAACLALGFGLYYVGFFGGADAKCLWCLGVTLPYSPTSSLGLNALGPQNPIFSISIFNNSILTAALLALGIACFNAIRRIKGPLFSEGEEDSLWRRSIALVLGYKMRISRVLSKKDFYFPLEEFVIEDGGVKRRFRLLTRCLDDNPYVKLRELVDKGVVKGDDEIWVSPAIPLIVNITLGFFIALFYGDLVLAIAKGLLDFIL
ncbi:MAG: A24 family peptidase [Candidatus Nezhaarchaeales archaeon]